MSTFDLIPLGTSPAWYNPGEACSGYLVRAGNARILVDCGPGVVSAYLARYGDAPIDAIVISHVHGDHILDLVPLKYGIDFGGLSHWHPQLWLPGDAHDRLRTLVSTWNGGDDFFSGTFDVRTYNSGASFRCVGVDWSSTPVPHFIDSNALRADFAGFSLTYSGDLGPCDAIVDLARGCDILLCEATLVTSADDPPDLRGHLTGGEAGRIARDSGAQSLLLTHVPFASADAITADARAAFRGPVALAEPGTAYAIAAHLAEVG